MWDRFTKRARELFDIAQDEAATRGQREVGTEHLLLGIIRDETFVAHRILVRAGLSPDALRASVERNAAMGTVERNAAMGTPVDKEGQHLTPSAQRVTDLAYNEARAMGDNYIGTEHLLLGLITAANGKAAQALTEAGVDLKRIRMILEQMRQGKC